MPRKIGLNSTDDLNDDLDKMADFIVQTYKTLMDALNDEYKHWAPNGKPLYPLIVMLEEWFMFGDKLLAYVDKSILRKMADAEIDPAIMEKYPYTICSTEDLELAIQIVAKTGIDTVMSKKLAGEYRLWSMYPFLRHAFADEMARVRGNLFPDDMSKIHPALGRDEPL